MDSRLLPQKKDSHQSAAASSEATYDDVNDRRYDKGRGEFDAWSHHSSEPLSASVISGEEATNGYGSFALVLSESERHDNIYGGGKSRYEPYPGSLGESLQQSFRAAVLISGDMTNSYKASPEDLGPLQYLVVFCCCYLNIVVHTFPGGLGVLYVPLLNTYNASSAETGLVQSLCNGLLFGGGIFSGMVVSCIGPGPTIVLGSLISTLGSVVSAFAPNIPTLIVTVGIIAGGGLSLLFISAWGTIGQLSAVLPRQAPTCMGMAGGMGVFIAPFVMAGALELLGLHTTYLLLAAITISALPPGLLIAYVSRRLSRLQGKHHVTIKTSWRDALHPELLTNWKYVLYGLVTIPWYSTVMAPGFFLVGVATDLGLDIQTGSICLSVAGASNVLGRLVPGILGHFCNCSGLVLSAIFTPLCGIVVALFTLAHDFTALMVISALFGFVFGFVNLSMPFAVLDELKSQPSYSAAVGYTFGISGIGDTICGPLGGAIRDITKSYNLIFWACAGTGLLQGAVHLALHCSCRYRQSSYKNIPGH